MQANSRCTITRELEITTSGEKFHVLVACKPHQLVKICPWAYRSCDLQEGEFGKNGSIIVWNYVHEGKVSVAKERVENVDMEKKTITFRVMEGSDVLDYYKSFLLHLHVMPKVGNISIVKWTFEYEKLNEDVPDPTSLINTMIHISKQVADHIESAFDN